MTILASASITVVDVMDGKSENIYIAYADTQDGRTGFSTIPKPTSVYFGIYKSKEDIQSTDPTRYKWSLFKGPKGDTANVLTGGVNYLSDWLFQRPPTWSAHAHKESDNNYYMPGDGVFGRTTTQTGWHEWQTDSEKSPGLNNIQDGEPYTLSVYAKAIKGNIKLSGFLRQDLTSGVPNNSIGANQYATLTQDWKRYVWKGIAVKDSAKHRQWRVIFNSNDIGEFQLKRPMFEWGNTVSDGSASPNDYIVDMDSRESNMNTLLIDAISTAQEAINKYNDLSDKLTDLPYVKVTDQQLYARNQEELRTASETQLKELLTNTNRIKEYLGDMTKDLIFNSKKLSVGEQGVSFSDDTGNSAVRIHDERIAFYTGGRETGSFTQGELNTERINVKNKLQRGDFIEEVSERGSHIMVVRYVGGKK